MLAPVAGAVTALSTLACCMPLGFVAAIGLAGLSSAVAAYQGWLLAGSVVLVGVGAWQLRQGRRACSTRRTSSTIVFCLSTAIVLMVILFPQVIAGFVADWWS